MLYNTEYYILILTSVVSISGEVLQDRTLIGFLTAQCSSSKSKM